jgi:hypothetical protein
MQLSLTPLPEIGASNEKVYFLIGNAATAIVAALQNFIKIRYEIAHHVGDLGTSSVWFVTKLRVVPAHCRDSNTPGHNGVGLSSFHWAFVSVCASAGHYHNHQ